MEIDELYDRICEMYYALDSRMEDFPEDSASYHAGRRDMLEEIKRMIEEDEI